MKENKDNKLKVAVLDFGSSMIKLAIAEKSVANSDSGKAEVGGFRLLHLDSEPSEGAVQRGVVFNLSETSEKVRQLLSRAEQNLGVKLANLYVNISGQGLHSQLIEQNATYDKPHEITKDDILKLWENIHEGDGKLFLNADFARFYINGNAVQKPVGVKATKLQVSIQTVLTNSYVAESVDEVIVSKLGLEVQPYLVGAVELSKLVLTAEQKRIGSALIDFGAETTTVCYFNHGVLETVRVLPMGGNQVTYDLTSLDISPDEAERVKITKGSLTLDTSDKEEIVVKAPDMLTDKHVSRYSVNQFIEARVHEVVDNIKAIISRAKGVENDYKLPGGIVVTGGASRLSGLIGYLKDKFGGELSVKQVEAIFLADNINSELISNPEFHNLYAMLYVATDDACESSDIEEAASVTTPEPVEPNLQSGEETSEAYNNNEGFLPFEEEELKVSPIVDTKRKAPKSSSSKKSSTKKKSWTIMSKFKDLFAMSEDEDLYSNDEE